MQQRIQYIFQWILKLVAALILLQTLYFKFSGVEESVFIFTQMHMEPWGRFVTGIAELVVALLILYKPTTTVGAILAIGIMSGAILSHLFVLGIEVKNDHGLLFIYALLVWLSALILTWLNRQQVFDFFSKMQRRRHL